MMYVFIDPCKPNPCYRGNKCTPLSDTKFKCADCPRGFAGDGVTCSPVNEVGCITLNRQHLMYSLFIVPAG